MVVDSTHLDEVRLVINEFNGNSKIINEFNMYDAEDHDVLRPLLEALTIGRSFLRTEGRRTVYVEGVTDYFYLNAFAGQMRRNGETVPVDFIPINGLGGNRGDRRKAINEILNIGGMDAEVVTDADLAGTAFKAEAKEKGLSVLTIAELLNDSKVIDIENLFSKEDAERLHLWSVVDGKVQKDFDASACFAQNFEEEYKSLTEQTKERFESLVRATIYG